MAKINRQRVQLTQKTALKTKVTYRLVLSGSALAVAVLFGIGAFLYGNLGNNTESKAAKGQKLTFKQIFRATPIPYGPTDIKVSLLPENQVELTWVNALTTKKEAETDGILILKKEGIVADDQPIDALQTDSVNNNLTAINGWTIVYNKELVSSFTDKNSIPGVYTYLVYEKNNNVKYTAPKNAARVFVFDGSNLSATLSTDTKVNGLTIPATNTLIVDEKASLSIRENSIVTVAGILDLKGSIENDAATWTVTNTGTFIFDRNGDGKKNGIPAAEWAKGSTCIVTGVTGSEPHGLNQHFENFTWNCANQTSDAKLPEDFIVKGNFAVQSTGSKIKTLYLQGTTLFNGDISVNDNTAKVEGKKKSQVIINGTENQTISGTWNFQSLSFNNPKTIVNSGNIVVNKSLTLDNGTVKNVNENGFAIADQAAIVRNGGSLNGQPSFAGVYDLTYLTPVTTGDEISANVKALRNLTINCDGNVVLGKTANVNGTLEFVKGKIITNENEVSISNTSAKSIKGYGDNGYVTGNLRRNVNSRGNYDFPVGNSSNIEVITVELSRADGFSNILAHFINDKPVVSSVSSNLRLNGTVVGNMLDAGYWRLTTNSPITAGVFNVTLNEKGNSNSAPSTRCYCVLRRTDRTAPWQFLGKHSNKSQSVNDGIVTAARQEVTSLGDFAIAYSGASLMLSRSTFSVKPVNGQYTDVAWSTNAELGSPNIIVERSGDAVNYEEVGEMQAKGQNADMLEFTFRDSAPLIGTAYYRIKQTTIDGNISYSDVQFSSIDPTNKASIQK